MSALAAWYIRLPVGYPKQVEMYIFILSNQPLMRGMNGILASCVKLYQGD